MPEPIDKRRAVRGEMYQTAYVKDDGRYRVECDRIPAQLYKLAQAKCQREGISMRALILGWLKEWVNQK